MERFRVTFTQTVKMNVGPSFLFTCAELLLITSSSKLMHGFTLVFSVTSCWYSFYLPIFYFEKFST